MLSRVSEPAFVKSNPVDAIWTNTVAGMYPNDKGVLLQMLMNYVALGPGDALHMPPCQPHAYLQGNGIEVMAASDNVLRAGLTPKHVDTNELLAAADFEAHELKTSPPTRIYGQDVADYLARRFDGCMGYMHGTTPKIALCTKGMAYVNNTKERIKLLKGEAVYCCGPLEVDARAGQVFSATTGA